VPHDRTALPESRITAPTYRRFSAQERGYWIDEYWIDMDGPFYFELEVIQLINEIRQQHDLEYLRMDMTLLMGARLYTQILAIMDHPNLSSDIGPYRNRRDFRAGYSASSNVAWSFGGQTRVEGGLAIAGLYTPQELVYMWMNDPASRNFILDPEHKFIGFGAHVGGQNGAFHYLNLSALSSPWIFELE